MRDVFARKDAKEQRSQRGFLKKKKRRMISWRSLRLGVLAR
jgi:hypothetical protein